MRWLILIFCEYFLQFTFRIDTSHNLKSTDRFKSGACFSKVPKLFGCISGEIVVFVSSKLRRLKARDFPLFLFLFPLQPVKRPPLQNKQVGV